MSPRRSGVRGATGHLRFFVFRCVVLWHKKPEKREITTNVRATVNGGHAQTCPSTPRRPSSAVAFMFKLSSRDPTRGCIPGRLKSHEHKKRERESTKNKMTHNTLATARTMGSFRTASTTWEESEFEKNNDEEEG